LPVRSRRCFAFGPAGIANAERVCDIGEFDSCTKMYIPPASGESVESYTEHMRWCCYKPGGDWAGASTGCVSPPAESQGLPGGGVGVTPGQAEDQVQAGTPKPRPTLPTTTGLG
jgi:hypothetical protein